MNTTLTVDKAGRVVLPKPVRDELQLAAGDSLELESSEDRIVLRPVRGTAGLRKKQGIWVLDVNEPISVEAVNRTIRDIRREREQWWLGRTSAVQASASAKKRKRR
jgi:AbrB family looped-hinge helix DNA binding protein